MTRRFFVLFFVYFFVVQSAILWIVRDEPKFYAIGIINLIFIFLMALFYNNFEKSENWDFVQETQVEYPRADHIINKHVAHNHASHRKPWRALLDYFFVASVFLLLVTVLFKIVWWVSIVNVWFLAVVYFVMLILSVKRLLDKKIYISKTIFTVQDFLFWSSMVLVIGVFGSLYMWVVWIGVLLSLLVGFVFFVVWTNISKDKGSVSVWNMWYTKIYEVLLVVCLCFVCLYAVFFGTRLIIQDLNKIQNQISEGIGIHKIENVGQIDVFTWDDILSNGTGEVLTNSLIDDQQVDNQTGLLNLDPDIFVSTGNSSLDTGDTDVDSRLSVAQNPTLMDTLIYLMDRYNVDLSVGTGTKFKYVTPNNPYYAQFKTAYDKKLIGSASNPSNRVICDSYMVMKGILEWWNVNQNASDLVAEYRRVATAKWVLNGCKKWFYINNVNL